MTVDMSRLAWAVVLYVAAALAVLRGPRVARRRWKEALLLVTSLALAAGVAEVALRLVRPYESLPRFRWIASRRLHHVNPPSRRMFSGYVGGVPVVVDTNEDGFRTRHTRASFARLGVRVAVLGDSFTFGSGVNEAEAFPSRLEVELARRLERDDVGVLNAGVISYSPMLQKIQIEDVLRGYRPSVVILLLDATDIGDDAVYRAKSRRRGEDEEFPLEGDAHLRSYGAVHELLRPGLTWLEHRLSYPVQLARSAVGRPEPTSANYYLNYVTFEGRQENRFFIYRYPLERTRPYFEETFRHVAAAASAAETAGARFLLAVSPRYHHWSARECPRDWQRGAYQIDEPFQFEYFRFFGEKAAGSSFPIFDLLPAFQATRDFPLVFPHDPHWNPSGHAFVARTLADYLTPSALLDGVARTGRSTVRPSP